METGGAAVKRFLPLPSEARAASCGGRAEGRAAFPSAESSRKRKPSRSVSEKKSPPSAWPVNQATEYLPQSQKWKQA